MVTVTIEGNSKADCAMKNGILYVAAIILLVWGLILTAGCGGNSTTTSTGTTAISITITASSPIITPGAIITFTAIVAPSAATGTVTFYDGPTSLGTATLVSGTASFTTISLTAGTHTIMAVYGGSETYSSSNSIPLIVTVTSGSVTRTTTALTASATSVNFGTSVILAGAVSPSDAAGTVTFYNGSTSLGTGTLASGAIYFTTTNELSAGSHILTAIYSGKGTYSASASVPITLTVASSSTTSTATTLTVPASSVTYGASTPLTANVSPAAATGTVTFYDGLTVLGTGNLTSGTASFTTSSLDIGTHTITAAYNGSSTCSSSTSSALNVTVSSPSAAGDYQRAPDGNSN
ncbi:MAG: hypothetical protein CSYNP_02128 [Syntrophus sp. SKADARSKE-3]|nr:hypothetical protein [Syntrophus sp. SKADARSKE-3]